MANARKYKLLMCDLDGTLVGKGHATNRADWQALHNARDAGLMISICTGRSWRESHHLIGDIPFDVPGVFSNGAELNAIATGKTIASHPFSSDIVRQILLRCRLRSLNPIVLLHQRKADDPLYAVDGSTPLHPATADWFKRNGVAHLITHRLDDQMLQRCLRVGLVLDLPTATELTQHMEEHFQSQLNIHLLQALHYDAAILEIFRHGVDKWTGILHLCNYLGIDPRDVVTIGDDVNDIPMLQNAHLSYAMGSASEHVRSSAKKTTLDHARSGVAAAVADLLSARQAAN